VPRNDWQLLDNAAQKAVATVSMIDCLWEKLTKVSDDVELLQQRLAPEPLEPQDPPEPPPCRAEMEELMKVCGNLEESTEAQAVQVRDLQHLVQQKLDDFSKELTDVKLAAEEKSSSAVSDISQDLLLLKGALEAQEQRQGNELQSSAEKLEMLELNLSSLAERQMQEMARQEQNLNQVKQLLVDICDEAFNNLRRLEISVQTEAQLRQGDKQIGSQQMDGLQQRIEALEGQQLKFSRSFEEMKRHLEVQDETRHRLDTELRELRELQELRKQPRGGAEEVKAELGALQKQLESQKQQSACVAELEASINAELRQLQQGLRTAKEQGPRLTEEMAISIGHLKEEIAEGLQELATRELTQRTSLEERSNALLDLGLQKLAKEVAERMDEVSERQHSAIVASESRLFGHFESWQNGFQEREAGREVQMKSTGEQLQRLENACKEISTLRLRLDETRQSIEEGLAASAMNAFQGEMRLWAKMAQFGMPQ